MKIVDKVKFTESYFKKNFKYKDMCAKLPYTEDIIAQLIYSVAFNLSIPEHTSDYIDDQYIEITKRLVSKKNKKFFETLKKKELSGTLLPYFSKNFKLIYHFDFTLFITSLIYSKYNKTYYYYHMDFVWDEMKNGKKKRKDDEVHFANVPKLFKSKPTKREFFEAILEREKEFNSKKKFDELTNSNYFEISDGTDLWWRYYWNEGIMKK